MIELRLMTDRKIRHCIKLTAHGLGFFTLVPIPNDKKIIEYIGPILSLDETAGKSGRYLMEIGDDYFIDGSLRAVMLLVTSITPTSRTRKLIEPESEYGSGRSGTSKPARRSLTITAKNISMIL